MPPVSLGVLSPASAPGRSSRPAPTAPAAPAGPDTLEVALLRRSLARVADASERCGHCHRTLLLGEQVYDYPSGALRCALCRDGERQTPAGSHRVHGAELGHSIRVIDRRAAA